MKYLFSAFLMVVFLGLTNCSVRGQDRDQVTSPILVDVQEAQNLIDESEIILIDVRTPNEVSQGYIPQALQWDFFRWEEFTKNAAELDQSKPVMVYCRLGGRSSKAANYLVEQGFSKVYDIEGGMTAWLAADLPVKID